MNHVARRQLTLNALPPFSQLRKKLRAVQALGASPEEIDAIVGDALDSLGTLVPFDLATIMQLTGDELAVRVARGPLDAPAVRAHRLDLSAAPALRRLIEARPPRSLSDSAQPLFDDLVDLHPGHLSLVIPLTGGGRLLGLMTLDHADRGAYPQALHDIAHVFARLLGLVMSYGEQTHRLDQLRESLEERVRLLAERVPGRNDACSLLEASRSPAMEHIVTLARRVATTDTPVLITGETGTGKEVLAHAIHGWSARAARPIVSINCAALPPGLIESELFGHIKGAFSGATANRIGRFQAADGGTLFLDEVGELPMELQAKLLRALQEGRFEPVGSDRTVQVDVRVVAATNRDLQLACARREFREDLYYRLAVFPIVVPPLRARPDDIAGIAAGFLDALARRTGRGPWRLRPDDLDDLRRRPWRGNVRELVNLLERATILAGGQETLDLALPSALAGALPGQRGTASSDPGSPAAAASQGSSISPPWPAAEPDRLRSLTQLVEPQRADPLPTLAEAERAHIERALARTGGAVYGEAGAAAILDIHPSTLQSRMRKLGLGGARAARERHRGSAEALR